MARFAVRRVPFGRRLRKVYKRRIRGFRMLKEEGDPFAGLGKGTFEGVDLRDDEELVVIDVPQCHRGS